MDSIGIVRNLDELGRVVLPVEIRRQLGIRNTDGLEIFVDNDRIILKKFVPACTFCGKTQEVQDFKGKRVCRDCLNSLTEKAVSEF